MDAAPTDDATRLTEHLRDTRVVTVVTHRRDGTPVPTYIWAVAVDGVGYLRSAFGTRSWWYRRASADPRIGFDLGAPDDDRQPASADFVDLVSATVEAVPDDAANAELQAAIDAEISRKYADEPENVAPTISAEARSCTFRVLVR